MKLKTKHKVAIIIALIPVISGIIITIWVNVKDHNASKKSEMENPININIDNRPQTITRDSIANSIDSRDYNRERVHKLEELKRQGESILKNYEQRKKDFPSWRSRCEGVLKTTDIKVVEKLREIEKNHVTHDYYSQIKDIIELLNSEISNQK